VKSSPAPNQPPPRDRGSARVRVVIDTPAGSRNKYKYDTGLGAFCISRRLPAGLCFPHDFGFIPQTCAEDGDALDVVVLDLEPTFPGCVVTVRPIGILKAQQTESGRSIRNDRLIGCGETPVNPARLKELRDLGEERIRSIELFFETYNRAQGRTFRITGRGNAQAARAALTRALAAFRRKQSA
jgi:inorganic pyrophosphatase